MDLKALATQMIMDKIGAANDPQKAESALGELMGSSSGLDLGQIVGQFTQSNGDLAAKAMSWLGDGDNEPVTASQVQDALGSDKVEAFASKLGVGTEEASSSLSDILPQLIDKSSRGGQLLDSVGGKEGLFGLASKFFK